MAQTDDIASRSRPSARAIRLTVRVVIPVLFALTMWQVFTQVVRFGYVFSSSMEPTLAEGDWYLLRLDAYSTQAPERGEIVVYVGPDGEPYVKRVIAVAGDHVAIIRGVVWLNRQALEEPYLKERAQNERPIQGDVPPEHLCVLGDNRNFSADSRDVGFGPVETVMGRVTGVVWPRERSRSLVATR